MPEPPPHADTILIGAGSAGAVLANRLTENASTEVLLLEAGPDYPTGDIPPDLRDGTRNSMRLHDWGFRHRPTPNYPGQPLPRGRVVGGSSAVNTCIALRPLPADLDEWAGLGLADWSFDQCLPSLRRLEHDLDFSGSEHGQDGPIPIRRHRRDELTPWQGAFLEACRELGFGDCPDLNAKDARGAGPHPMNKIDGRRMSVADGYLNPDVRARDNLRIEADCLVRRILFRDRTVQGVELERHGQTYVVHCKRLILSAGAIGTPSILLRSGVGPRNETSRLGVEFVAHNPGVGARILDHPGVAIVLLPKAGIVDISQPLIQTALRYTSTDAHQQDDMQLQPGSWLPLSKAGGIPMVSLMAQVGKPRGVGRFRLPSAEIHARPEIDNDFLVDADDLDRATEAMELAWLLATSDALKPLASCLFPRERHLVERRRIRSWLRSQCGSGYHPCGTVPMGPTSDPDAATDPDGRLRGVEGVWVADASLMPTIPTVNINITTIMMGEHLANWLS